MNMPRLPPLDNDLLFPGYCFVFLAWAVIMDPVLFVPLAFLVGLHKVIHPTPLTMGVMVGTTVAGLTMQFNWFNPIMSILALNIAWGFSNPREFILAKATRKDIEKNMKLHRWHDAGKNKKKAD